MDRSGQLRDRIGRTLSHVTSWVQEPRDRPSATPAPRRGEQYSESDDYDSDIEQARTLVNPSREASFNDKISPPSRSHSRSSASSYSSRTRHGHGQPLPHRHSTKSSKPSVDFEHIRTANDRSQPTFVNPGSRGGLYEELCGIRDRFVTPEQTEFVMGLRREMNRTLGIIPDFFEEAFEVSMDPAMQHADLHAQVQRMKDMERSLEKFQKVLAVLQDTVAEVRTSAVEKTRWYSSAALHGLIQADSYFTKEKFEETDSLLQELASRDAGNVKTEEQSLVHAMTEAEWTIRYRLVGWDPTPKPNLSPYLFEIEEVRTKESEKLFKWDDIWSLGPEWVKEQEASDAQEVEYNPDVHGESDLGPPDWAKIRSTKAIAYIERTEHATHLFGGDSSQVRAICRAPIESGGMSDVPEEG